MPRQSQNSAILENRGAVCDVCVMCAALSAHSWDTGPCTHHTHCAMHTSHTAPLFSRVAEFCDCLDTRFKRKKWTLKLNYSNTIQQKIFEIDWLCKTHLYQNTASNKPKITTLRWHLRFRKLLTKSYSLFNMKMVLEQRFCSFSNVLWLCRSSGHPLMSFAYA